MMISTRGRYALRILVDLAENQQLGYVTLKEVAGRQEISEKYLESIVKQLVKEGILKALRGKGGGYCLGRLPEQINVLEVLELMEGTLAPVACLEEDTPPCTRMAECRTLGLWKGLDEAVRNYLSAYTIEDLMQKETEGFDYVI